SQKNAYICFIMNTPWTELLLLLKFLIIRNPE
ncbi:MAG: hypothetical protein ACI87F_001347, partial [Candidatus Azotimanducaceae bacterium]